MQWRQVLTNRGLKHESVLNLRAVCVDMVFDISLSGEVEGVEKNSAEIYTGRFIMFSLITNIYNKKTKGPTLMELFTSTGKLKKVFFDN
jgi:hypothetical protein